MTGDTGQPGFGGSGNCIALALATATGAGPFVRRGYGGKAKQRSSIATSRKQGLLCPSQSGNQGTKQHACGEARADSLRRSRTPATVETSITHDPTESIAVCVLEIAHHP